MSSRTKRYLFILGVICLLALILLVFSRIVVPTGYTWAQHGPVEQCRTQLKGLGRAMSEYRDKEGKLPLFKNWGDILRDELHTAPPSFICPGTKTEDYSYAMNKYVIDLNEIPGDVVLLFDSKPGWDQVGGPELLAPENHDGKGCNILFGNLEVSFIEKDKFSELKWKVEERPAEP